MKIEILEQKKAKVSFEVSVEEFEHGLSHAYNHIQKDVSAKGFRKGKVPQGVYEKEQGVETLYDDALMHIFSHKWEEVILESGLEIASSPKVVDFDFKNLKRGSTFSFGFLFALKPDVVLGDYKGLKTSKENLNVSEEEVNERINLLLDKESISEPKEEQVLENGDTAIFDFEGYRDGVLFDGGKAENYQLVIGSQQFIPGFEEQMVGMKQNEERSIDLTFPADYHAPDLAGAKVTFKVKLHEVKVTKRPLLTDELVKKLKIDNVSNVLELKEDVLKKLQSDKETSEKKRISDDLLSSAVHNVQVDIPEEIIDSEVHKMIEDTERMASQYGIDLDTYLKYMGSTKEKFMVDARTEARKNVLERLVLEKIVVVENIQVGASDIEQKYNELAVTLKQSVDELKKRFGEDQMSYSLSLEKALSLIVDSAILE